MQVYGVWSDQAGGFVANGPTEGEAREVRLYLLEKDGDEAEPEDLKVVEQCPDHEDEPAFGCSYCDADEDLDIFLDDDEPMMNTEEGQ